MTNDNERIDDLQRNGYRIIQNKDCSCFGMDAVLLSSFAQAQKNEQVLDLGTGNGVIPILMQAKILMPPDLPDWKFRRSVRTLPKEAWN